MALLAPSDWQPPRDGQQATMDSPSGSRTRASPANDGAGPTTPQQQQQQQQQQLQQPPQQPRQASPSLTVNGVNGSPGGGSPYQAAQAWTPSPTAQPFYPQFYPQGAVPIPSPPIGVGVNGSPLQGAPGGVGVPNGGPLPPPMHAGQAPPFMHMQGTPIPSPYYDPNANAQFAQWYHHVMLQQMGQFPQQMVSLSLSLCPYSISLSSELTWIRIRTSFCM
jgi:hypothetical protein